MRLLLAVSDDGRRWLTRVPNDVHPPKSFRRYGREYTVIMTMARKHHARAVRWWKECQHAPLGKRAKLSVAEHVRR